MALSNVFAIGSVVEIAGTSFHVTLPMAPTGRPRAPEPPETARGNLPPLKILLAEDILLNRMIVEKMLRHNGHEVVSVENGAEAVAAVQQDQFDLVLMDMRMPVMDGAAAIQAIRALPQPASDLPVIALTADALEEEHKAFLRSGIDKVLTKPVDWDALTRAALDLIHRK